MMNYIWACILLASLTYSAFSGRLGAFGQAMMNSSTEAVTFIISLAGVMAMWSGLMEIAEKTGASTATISRVNRSLNYGNDGYELVFGRLNK